MEDKGEGWRGEKRGLTNLMTSCLFLRSSTFDNGFPRGKKKGGIYSGIIINSFMDLYRDKM